MDPNALAGMAFTLILTVMVGGFILLFPLSRKLGQLLESKVLNKNGTSLTPDEIAALQNALNSLQGDVRRLTDRQEFIEKLLSGEKLLTPEKRAALPPKDS